VAQGKPTQGSNNGTINQQTQLNGSNQITWWKEKEQYELTIKQLKAEIEDLRKRVLPNKSNNVHSYTVSYNQAGKASGRN
jgi:hypothetical protein